VSSVGRLKLSAQGGEERITVAYWISVTASCQARPHGSIVLGTLLVIGSLLLLLLGLLLPYLVPLSHPAHQCAGGGTNSSTFASVTPDGPPHSTYSRAASSTAYTTTLGHGSTCT
jgi:hypothetical protein